MPHLTHASLPHPVSRDAPPTFPPQCGVGLPEDEVPRLLVALGRLLDRHPSLSALRFWGVPRVPFDPITQNVLIY